MSGWTTMMGGAIERAAWSDVKGLLYLPKKSIKLEKGWGWTGPWLVEGRDVRGSQSLEDETIDHDGTYDGKGWQYSDRFGNTFGGHQKTLDFVRRRKWVRVAERIPEDTIAVTANLSPRVKTVGSKLSVSPAMTHTSPAQNVASPRLSAKILVAEVDSNETQEDELNQEARKSNANLGSSRGPEMTTET